MNLEKMSLTSLNSNEVMKTALEGAQKYGYERGRASAIGDKYASLGGPTVEVAIKDYAEFKFGAFIEDVPRELIKALRKGFSEGQSEMSRELANDGDDHNIW